MILFRHLDKLRHKPEHYRKIIALALSISITVLIIGVWISVVRDRLFVMAPPDGGGEFAVALEEKTPIESLWSGLQNLTKAFSLNLLEIKSQIGTTRYIREEE